MQPHRLADEVMLIDDSYNANPDSVRAAIDVLASLPAPRVLVLGDMGEVGENGPAMHEEVGAYARECGIEHLLTLGQATRSSAIAFGSQAVVCETNEQARVRPRELLYRYSKCTAQRALRNARGHARHACQGCAIRIAHRHWPC
jgi:murE/murF fusion protein